MENLIFNKPMSFYEEKRANHTAREISSQPTLWRILADNLDVRRDEITGFMNEVMAKKDIRIIFTGAGSSAFVGETMQYMLANEMGIYAETIHTTDIIGIPESTLRDVPTVLISYARSGESPESAATVEFAKKRISDLYNIVIVCDKNSSLGKLGDSTEKTLVLDMPEGSCDMGFAMTSSVSCMALATWALFHYQEMGIYTGYIRALADSMADEIEYIAARAEEIAANDYTRIVWLGMGALKGLSREAAIKSMELTNGYTNASYDAPTGFRHGPKTVINDESITIHFISNQPYTARYDVDFAKEMIGEKKKNLVVTVKQDRQKESVSGEDYEVVYSIPESLDKKSEMGAYIKCLVFSQLLSFKKSLERGFTTDNPCPKGEVNRVVQGIVIYDIE